MKWISKYKGPEGQTFEIEYEKMHDSKNNEDLDGYFFRVISKDGDRDYDYLLFDFESALEQAKDFNVPEDSWTETE